MEAVLKIMESLPERTNYLTSLSKKLDSEEVKIIEKKYKSPQLGKLSEADLLIASAKLVLKIHVIVGWVVPEGSFQDELVNQLAEKLKEDYSRLNMDEIEYAFRKNTSVQDWGKAMNLQLIDTVLIDYLDKRSQISRIEEQLKPVEQKLYSEEEILNQRRAEIELKYQAMRGGKVLPIPGYLEEVIRSDFGVEDVSGFFVNALNNQVENIYKKG